MPGGAQGLRYLRRFLTYGHLLASGSKDGELKVWDVQKRKELATLVPQKGRVNAVSFSPDGKTLACGARRTSNL